MNALTPTQPDPADPMFFVHLGEQALAARAAQQHATRAAAPDPDDEHFTEANDFEDVDPRHDGWTPDRQRRFLTALARGFPVSRACDMVGMSRQSAYALRESARGAAFALGWDAALLRARDVLVDELMDRAFNGVRDTVTHDDGRTVTRHRHDNRLALQMLARLDKRAEAACSATGAAAARIAAADFEQLLDLIGRGAAPARAGLFLAARIDRAGVDAAGADDLAPVRTLARADRWLRTHADVAQTLDAQGLDPARRGEWSGQQWALAEAAGLVQLAPPDASSPHPEPAADTPRSDCQLRQPPPPADPDNPDDEPVWWCSIADDWRTRFPPPDDFLGEEAGEFGDPGYARSLTAEEQDAVEAPARVALAALLPAARADRDAWFAAITRDDDAAAGPAAQGDIGDGAGGWAGVGAGASDPPPL